MARVTVEDCVRKVSNRFELISLASQRVHQIVSGEPLSIERDNDKNPVVALREIAKETIKVENLKRSFLARFKKIGTTDDEDELLSIVGDVEIASAESEVSESKEELLEVSEGMNMEDEIEADHLHVVDSPDE